MTRARFRRLEGAHFAGGAFWFDDTAGGDDGRGQVFRYLPSTETLELFIEGSVRNGLQSPDNLVVAPFGHVWLRNAAAEGDWLLGVPPDGDTYVFARNRLNDSELAGITFAPDGRTLFLNIFEPGITFAVRGPFPPTDPGATRRMAAATPPRGAAPHLADWQAHAAGTHGLSTLEAAAYARLEASL